MPGTRTSTSEYLPGFRSEGYQALPSITHTDLQLLPCWIPAGHFQIGGIAVPHSAAQLGFPSNWGSLLLLLDRACMLGYPGIH
jgi:hypothetical protein